ncbi:MAG: hypothetical protein AAF581_20765 [Planctomycetota bacterium]
MSRRILIIALLCIFGGIQPADAQGNRVILVIGYWPPTNEMLRPFSPTLNLEGWVGQNWQGRGYDVYAYFPEFSPPNCQQAPGGNPCLGCGVGFGDFRVDYTSTLADFNSFAALHQPAAILTTSWGGDGTGVPSWEVELNYWNIDCCGSCPAGTGWFDDCDPSNGTCPDIVPPEPGGPTRRDSTLPINKIVETVNLHTMLDSSLCASPGSAGRFVSAYIAYLGVMYRAAHAPPVLPATAPDYCVAAGHIHVADSVTAAQGTEATELSLAVIVNHVDDALGINRIKFVRGNANGGPTVDVSDVIFVMTYLFLSGAAPDCYDAADANDDGIVDIADPILLLGHLFSDGRPPPAPGAVCGPDPTPDALDCQVPLCL